MVTFNEEITVGVGDDDEAVVGHLRSEIEERKGITLVEVSPEPDGLVEEASRLDLVMVDPRRGGEGSRDLLARLTSGAWPLVVVVTSDRELAVPAFEQGVLDFLLKPVQPKRLLLALDRGIESVRTRRDGRILQSLLQPTGNGRIGGEARNGDGRESRFPGRLLIREQGRVYLIDTERIRFIRSDGNYVRIYEEDREHLARGTMDQVLECLDRTRFVRIHRSTIVNIEWVREFVPDMKGRYLVRMEGGTELVLSRSYRDDVLKRAL